MSLTDEFTPLNAGPESVTAWDAIVAADPVDGKVEVLIPGFDADLRFGPAPYVAPAGEPARGDRCLVVFGKDEDDHPEPWVLVEGVGGGGDPTAAIAAHAALAKGTHGIPGTIDVGQGLKWNGSGWDVADFATALALAALAANVVHTDVVTPQTVLSRLNIDAPTGVALNLDGNLDGTGGGDRYRLGFGIGTVNGENGGRGGSPDAIDVDAANGAGSSFYAPFYQNSVFTDRGSMTQYTGYLTVDEVGAGGVYGEGYSFYGGVTSNRKGALTGGIEVQNTINSGKPARGSAGTFIVKDGNAPPAYTGFARTAENGYTTADFGASSEWLKGARVLDLVSSGAQEVGVGINFRGVFTRPILYEPDANNGFAVGREGFVEVLGSSAFATLFRGYSASESKQQERLRIRADGQYGVGPGSGAIDTLLERVQNSVWKLTCALQLTAIAAASVPINTIFLDSADATLKQKNNAGVVSALGGGVAAAPTFASITKYGAD